MALAEQYGFFFLFFFFANVPSHCLLLLKAGLILNTPPTHQGALALFHCWYMGGAFGTLIWQLGRGEKTFGLNHPPSYTVGGHQPLLSIND